MVTSMGIRFPKTIANKLRCPPGGRILNNPIWPPLEHENLTYQLNLWVESSVIPIFPCFYIWRIHFCCFIWVNCHILEEKSIFYELFDGRNQLNLWYTPLLFVKCFWYSPLLFWNDKAHTHTYTQIYMYIYIRYVHFKNLNSHHFLITKSSASTHTLISCYFVLIDIACIEKFDWYVLCHPYDHNDVIVQHDNTY